MLAGSREFPEMFGRLRAGKIDHPKGGNHHPF
jgi:hypothetical protein